MEENTRTHLSYDEQLKRFPQYPWMRSTASGMTIGHGLLIHSNGDWVIPKFQRPLVWTQEQKISFVESVLTGLPIGEYTLHYDEKSGKSEVLDGQQRWNAIFEFVDDQFSIFNDIGLSLFYKDFTQAESRHFRLSCVFPVREITHLTEEQKYQCYLKLAYGGTPHTPLG